LQQISRSGGWCDGHKQESRAMNPAFCSSHPETSRVESARQKQIARQRRLTMYKRTLAVFALLTLTVTFTGNAQTQQPAKPAEQKTPLSEAELTARTDKRRAMQWYVIEPMALSTAEGGKIMREEGQAALDTRYGRYRFRLEAATFEELTGFDSKLTDADISPLLKEYLKQQIVSDLLEMYRKGTSKQSTGSSSK
jgi:hypothetical protein